MLTLTVNRHSATQRLDRFLRKSFPSVPLSYLFAIMRKKKVRVNGIVSKPDCKLKESDTVLIYENLPQNTSFSHDDSYDNITPIIDITKYFVMQTPEFVIINKPYGLPCHSGSGVKETESLSGILALWAKREGLDFKPALVHRLDKDTSGLIIAALSGHAVRDFGYLMRNRYVKREYLTLVHGNMEKKRGKIIMPSTVIEKESKSNWVLEKTFADFDLLRVNLETGHKHQIRISFAHIGHPVLGDKKYGNFLINREYKKKIGLNRLFLHSTRLHFYWKTKIVDIEIPLPLELTRILPEEL